MLGRCIDDGCPHAATTLVKGANHLQSEPTSIPSFASSGRTDGSSVSPMRNREKLLASTIATRALP
jgi:hypothetical protein